MGFYRRMLIGCGCGVALSAAAPADSPTQWDFETAGLAASFGAGAMEFWDLDPNFAGQTEAATDFGTTAGFGIAPIAGVVANVMEISAYTGEQGLLVNHGTPSNGGGSYGNQYTLVYDIFIRNEDFFGGSGWLPFYNTNCCNANDADAYIQMGFGIGIDGDYTGVVSADTWYRIAFVYDLAAAGVNHWKYIDGALAGTQELDGGVGLDGRFALYTTDDPDIDYDGFYLFTEGDTSGQYTTRAYLNSIYFTDRALSAAEIAAFGSADADGISSGETPCPGDLNGDNSVGLSDLTILLANFGTASGATPEQGDIDGDTDVDLSDLTAFLANFGTICG